MGCHPSTRSSVSSEDPQDRDKNDHGRNQRKQTNTESAAEGYFSENDVFNIGDRSNEIMSKGIPYETIMNKCPQPKNFKDMKDSGDKNSIYMIKPWRYDKSKPDREPKPINDGHDYIDRWDKNHVLMPCSSSYTIRKKQPQWPVICRWLNHLKQKCNERVATFEDLKVTIENCNEHQYDMSCLGKLINKVYLNDQRDHFMYTVLPKVCDLALTVDLVCTESPPLLYIGSNHSVTMSQRQAASLLACAFFCLFPFRSDQTRSKEYENYQNPNFDNLYRNGPQQKIEKLKCILHYFRRVTEQMPNGVITFQRFTLLKTLFPQWDKSESNLCDVHLTTGRKIEEINNALQVDFANKYIGGGVLGSGCVQEEIRFSICPEMLVSLLLCEMMEKNECIFLIGCERYSSYKGYAGSFQFAGNYADDTPKDSWGRKCCHLVAMDALYFRDPSVQYQMEYVERELLKAYTSFLPLKKEQDYEFCIATGNWGCGAFRGDKQLKAIIQLMAASEVGRPLIYAAYGDKKLVSTFADIYDYLKEQRTTVRELYDYIQQYSREHNQSSLFEYIRNTPALISRTKV